MKLPQGHSTLTLMIQPLVNGSEKFKPFLYWKRVEHLGQDKDTIDFPPSTQDNAFRIKRVYSSRGYLQTTERIDVKGDDEGVAFSLFLPPSADRQKAGSAEVMLYAAATTKGEHVLAPNTEYVKTLFNDERISYLKLDS